MASIISPLNSLFMDIVYCNCHGASSKDFSNFVILDIIRINKPLVLILAETRI